MTNGAACLFFSRTWSKRWPMPRSSAQCRSLRKRSEEHTSELQSHSDLVCRLLLEKKIPVHRVDFLSPNCDPLITMSPDERHRWRVTCFLCGPPSASADLCGPASLHEVNRSWDMCI